MSRFSYNYRKTSCPPRSRRASSLSNWCRSTLCRRDWADWRREDRRSRLRIRPANAKPQAAPTIMPPADLSAYCLDLARRAREASRLLATASGAAKDYWLQAAATAIEQRQAEILAANVRDLAGTADMGLTGAE